MILTLIQFYKCLQVNGAVDAMDGERSELQSQIESYKVQLSAAMELIEEEKTKSQEIENKLLSMGATVSV